MPGLRYGVEDFLGERINELLSGERTPIAVRLRGPDLDALQRAARDVVTLLEATPGIESVSTGALTDVPTTNLAMRPDALGVAGLDRAEVVRAAAALRQGLVVSDVRTASGFSVPVVVAGAPDASRDGLSDLPVLDRSGSAFPLSAAVEVRTGAEPATIVHEGGQRMIAVTADAERGELTAVADRIEAAMRHVALPPGVRWELAGQAAERASATSRLLLVTAVVLVVIFVFLWAAFGSALDAGVVMAGIPLGMVGGVVAALSLPEGLSMAALIGFVTLFGIISRNGIMLVQHKNDLLARRGETSAEEAILQAARERLVPILMTAGAAFFGLLPLALSVEAAGSELEAPMAAIVCAGLISSTALNLIAVPAFYLWRARNVEPA